jgi:hypothetical protein
MRQGDMSEVILVGLITAGSALAGVFISQFFEARKRASEERRWYAEFFLGRKVDALHNLYAALMDSDFEILRYGYAGVPSNTQKDKDRVHSVKDRYMKAFGIAALYLDKDTRRKIIDYHNTFSEIMIRLVTLEQADDSAPKVLSADWDKLSQEFKDITESLSQMLNPPALIKAARLR